MTFSTFLSTYNGQQNVGNTTENKGECVGLVCVYVDTLQLPHIWGHAMDLFINADEKFFEKILNTPDAIPQVGDIVVWAKAFNGTFGHTGIATGTGDLNTFECFEQNDPIGSNCHLKTYNYNNVKGWVRPIVEQSQQLIIDQLKADLLTSKDLYQKQVQHTIEQEDAINALQSSNKALTDDNTKDKATIEGLTNEKTSLQTSVQTLTNSLGDTTSQLEVCNGLLANRKDLAKYTTKELIKEIFGRFHLGRK